MARARREKLINIGKVTDKYHQLFVNRLDREGRGRDFFRRRSELYHSQEWDGTWKQTWWPVAREFGFESKAKEVELYEKYMMEGARTKMSEELKQLKEELIEEQQEERIESIPDADTENLPVDIAWVYNHPAMLRPCDGKADLKPSDYDNAPSKGAAGMLLYAMNNKRDFYKLVMAHLSKKDAAGETDKDMEDDLRDIKEIEAMLAQL